jgi:biopolymer transport protein ExbD
MAQQLSDNEETLSEVNVIPLADLSLVLLIILMVLSPMIHMATIQITSGKATAALTREELEDEKPETPLVVSYEPGILKLNGEVISPKIDLTFVKRFEMVVQKRKDKAVNLTASPALSHGEVVHLMDIVRRHGAESLVMLKWDPNAGALASANNPGAAS